MATKYPKEIESMIAKAMKRRECKRDEAIAYMLAVATGRLAALWRYSDTLPEGKASKGVRKPGAKKPAKRTKSVVGIVSPHVPAPV